MAGDLVVELRVEFKDPLVLVEKSQAADPLGIGPGQAVAGFDPIAGGDENKHCRQDMASVHGRYDCSDQGNKRFPKYEEAVDRV